VSPEHACWSDEDSARKVRKQRFGKVVKAEIDIGPGENGVGKMLKRYEEESAQWMLSKVAEWEKENLGEDPDETEDEDSGSVKGDGNGSGSLQNEEREVRSGPDLAMEMGDEMPTRPQGLQQSIRVPAFAGMAASSS
jgi:histone deacetylase 6